MASPAAPTPPRRRQAERRASTRTRLLDATLGCLVDQGYAGTTTAAIEARAGVSRGARLHHFPSKEALLVAAVEHLFEGIGERYAAGMEAAPEGGARFHQGYRLLWETYADPAQAAVFEIFVAARTNPALREALRTMWTGHHQEVRRRANAYFPELAHRDASGLLETLQCAMAGLALRRLAFGETPRDEAVLALLERMVGATFGSPEARTGGTE
jgi:AcrR family transcriptional regulator